MQTGSYWLEIWKNHYRMSLYGTRWRGRGYGLGTMSKGPHTDSTQSVCRTITGGDIYCSTEILRSRL